MSVLGRLAAISLLSISVGAPALAEAPVAPGPVVGRIDIPRLGIAASVRDGDDDETLRHAVGHISGTPMPGPAGNAGLAAHRNTFFRPLKDVKKEDLVVVTTATGTHRYRVTSIDVVQPKDVWVLDPTPSPTLTLVTCFPFDWVGDAPQRLIVRADRVEDAVGPAKVRTAAP